MKIFIFNLSLPEKSNLAVRYNLILAVYSLGFNSKEKVYSNADNFVYENRLLKSFSSKVTKLLDIEKQKKLKQRRKLYDVSLNENKKIKEDKI